MKMLDFMLLSISAIGIFVMVISSLAVHCFLIWWETYAEAIGLADDSRSLRLSYGADSQSHRLWYLAAA
jgi:hypothetical protein